MVEQSQRKEWHISIKAGLYARLRIILQKFREKVEEIKLVTIVPGRSPFCPLGFLEVFLTCITHISSCYFSPPPLFLLIFPPREESVQLIPKQV